MFDWVRQLTSSPEERRQADISAYLDGELSAVQRQKFERQMAEDEALLRDVRQQQSMLHSLRRLSQVRAPRSFALTPDMVAEQVSTAAWSFQPVLQLGLTVAAIALIAFGTFNLAGVSILPGEQIALKQDAESAAAPVDTGFMPATDSSEEVMAEVEALEAQVVEVTRVVKVITEAETEVVVEEEAQAEPAEMAAEMAVEEAVQPAEADRSEAEAPQEEQLETFALQGDAVSDASDEGGAGADSDQPATAGSAPVVATLPRTTESAAPALVATSPGPRPMPAAELGDESLLHETVPQQEDDAAQQSGVDRPERIPGNTLVGVATLAAGVLTLVAAGWLWRRRR